MNEVAEHYFNSVSDVWSSKLDWMIDTFKDVPHGEELLTEHHIHAGVYSRTVLHKKGIVVVGAKWLVDTQFIVNGKVRLFTCDGDIDIDGFRILEGLKGRQIVSFASKDTYVTALFSTNAKTVEEAELEAFGEDGVKRLVN